MAKQTKATQFEADLQLVPRGTLKSSPIIRTHYFKGFVNDNERSVLPSLTIPDQSMSVETIMSRHARGLPLLGANVPQFHGEDIEIPELRKLDLSEIDELKRQNMQLIREKQMALQQDQERKRRKRIKDETLAEYKAEQEKLKKTVETPQTPQSS